MSYTLTDLDELLHDVRDSTSKEYIHEAILAYRNRAYRAAIVSIWIAVTYDMISKLRELANQGDAAAAQEIRHLDNAVSNNKIDQLQRIESDLLKKSERDFEIIGRREFEDLDRLKDDRNQCAHPAFNAEATLFVPSPELVRIHIVHAIQHLLIHAPIQGNAALARIKEDILRPSFPVEQDRVSEFMEAKYLNSAKPSLLKTLLLVFLKVLILESDTELKRHEEKVRRCLKAIELRFPDVYENEMPEQLVKVTEGANDEQLFGVFGLLGVDQRCWAWLGMPAQVRLSEMIRQYDSDGEHAPEILNALGIEALRRPIMEAFAGFDTMTKWYLLSLNPRRELAHEIVDLYADVGSFRGAESFGTNILLPIASSLSASQVQDVLKAIQTNNQLHFAKGTPEIVSQFFELTGRHHITTTKAWQDLMGFL
ncbi:MAG: hypothetical protein H8D93_00575, partial [Verrucomicrobia bacterium]|nr:hypothetical protein [Verrucomicrobiota bacterium]